MKILEVMMFFFRLSFLTCAFYAILTLLLGTTLWTISYFRGFGIFFSGKHPGSRLGVTFGVVLGIIWIISYAAAWSIIYFDLRSKVR